MRIGNPLFVVAGGLAMAAATVAMALFAPSPGRPGFVPLTAVLAAGYIVAVVAVVDSKGALSRRFVLGCMLLAIAVRAPLWLQAPGTDVYRYVWDARVQQKSYNPYAIAPADPEFAWLHTDETRGINNAGVPTPYPPGAQLLFRMVYGVRQTAYAFKVAFAVCDLLLAFVVWRTLEIRKASPGWMLVYAWSPLLILATAGEAHVDIAGALFLATSALLLRGGRSLLSALAFAMAVAIKPLPIVLLPLLWRRIRVVDAAAGAGLLLLLAAPYLTGGSLPVGSLGIFVDRFRFNETLFVPAAAILGPRVATALAVAGGLALAAVLRARAGVERLDTWAWPMAIALIASPVVYPWYLLWLLPFTLSRATLPLLVWSVSILTTYAVWHTAELGGVWIVTPGVLAIEFGSVLAVGAGVLISGWGQARRSP